MLSRKGGQLISISVEQKVI